MCEKNSEKKKKQNNGQGRAQGKRKKAPAIKNV